MYIEEELWNWIEKRCAKANVGVTKESIEDIINDCGVWYSYHEIKLDDGSITLEDCFKNYWYIVFDDYIRFTNADDFSEDLDEYLGLGGYY